MSTHDLAHGIASLGRYGDTTLVHVNPRELHGLETLIGRRMTTNPHTGMKEAFGWVDLIPIVAGIGGTVLSGGNVGVGALAAGAAKSGVSASQGDSAGTALTKGLITGATSYAAGSALEGIGTAADAAQAASATGSSAAAAGTAAAAPGAATAATAGGTEALAMAPEAVAAPLAEAAPAAGTGGISNLPTGGEALPMPPPAPGPAPAQLTAEQLKAQPGQWAKDAFRGQSYGDQAADIGRGITDPKLLGNYAMEHPGQMLTAGAGVYAAGTDMLGPANPQQGKPMASTPSSYQRYEPYQRKYTMPAPGYRPGTSAENRYFAAGGPVSSGPTMQDIITGQQNGQPMDMSALGAMQPAVPMAAPAPRAAMVMPPADYRPGVDPTWNYFPQAPVAPGAGGEAGAAPAVPVAPPVSSTVDGGGGAGAYAAGGPVGRGLAGLPTRGMPSHADTMGLVEEAKLALMGQHPHPEEALNRFAERFGPHAITALKADMQRQMGGGGGPVEGPGGGLDDAVPASIDGREPAKLSNGEFVVPADAVSGLGDGSTQHGIRQLDGMVNRVRQQRTGTPAQPRRVSGAIPV